MENKRHVTIVSHTHWDRAWYVTFQEFRARLVRLIDRLLRTLDEEPDFRVFTLDGQMAVLEDYLEVRPQRQAELEALCRQGRIKVGPWYVLADEFLVSPEALIRNLQLGHRMGAAYGGVSKIGYVPDGFGHIAQMPQILNGFGIDNAFFWRGLGAEGERLGTEFMWSAPDGSCVTTIWMPLGYHNISNLGYPIHWGDTSQMYFDMELALQQISGAVEKLAPRSHTGEILLMNGIDHEEAEPRLPEVIRQANLFLKENSFMQGTLEEHLARVRAASCTLPSFRGEFRWGRYSEVLQGVYATRIYLKQWNQRVENLLEKYSESLAALAKASGAAAPEGTHDLLWTAWRWLLRNHPHDDIYGSGIDAVHEEMLYRFGQAEQIGRIVVRDSLRLLARQVDFSQQPGMPVLVYNPLGWERQEMTVAELDFEFDDPLADAFRLVDSAGQEVAYQVLDDQPAFWMETLKANRKRRLTIAFSASVPACGYAAYAVQPPTGSPASAAPEGETWQIRSDGAENRYLSFSIAPDGGLTVEDKASGATYPGLNHFADVEDAGDEYSYCPCANSQTLTTHDRPAEIRVTAQGPNLVTFEVRRVLPVPESLSEDRQSRSETQIDLPIVSQVTLYRDRPGLYIETSVDNHARDHKLSAVFPSSLNPAQAHIDQPFVILARDIDLPDAEGFVEDPTPLMHQRAFTDLSENGRGLAIFNRGLPAVEVARQAAVRQAAAHQAEGAQIDLVLLRCVGWLSRDDLSNRRVAAGPLVPTPGAQCQGTFRFEYAIYPHSGDWRSVYPAAYNYISPLLATRADTHEGLNLHEMNITRDDPQQIKAIPWPRGGKLPARLSFFSVDRPEFVLSALKQGEEQGNLILRYFNASPDAVTARVTAFHPLQAAWLVNLNEERLQPLALTSENSFDLLARGWQVVTVEMELR